MFCLWSPIIRIEQEWVQFFTFFIPKKYVGDKNIRFWDRCLSEMGRSWSYKKKWSKIRFGLSGGWAKWFNQLYLQFELGYPLSRIKTPKSRLYYSPWSWMMFTRLWFSLANMYCLQVFLPRLEVFFSVFSCLQIWQGYWAYFYSVSH